MRGRFELYDVARVVCGAEKASRSQFNAELGVRIPVWFGLPMAHNSQGRLGVKTFGVDEQISIGEAKWNISWEQAIDQWNASVIFAISHYFQYTCTGH